MSGAADGLRMSRETLTHRLAAMDRLIAQASHHAHQAASTDRAVVATVDGNGRLLGLQVDPAALRGGHPQRVGPEVVRAVAAARRLAAEAKAQRVRLVFGTRGGR